MSSQITTANKENTATKNEELPLSNCYPHETTNWNRSDYGPPERVWPLELEGFRALSFKTLFCFRRPRRASDSGAGVAVT
ncbi:hypothetical protein NECAME_08188 [Necator americanus]|uniref:Uncharacterized protein n=1 Tax=Necator americanus TaxID=51031 RepID=W2TKD7_NECAM|nr:hypothetical protein NECAME_08188 [Necator americanus]ETN82089.1 hypothetical protein NECAME_08188 [Necator americanus]